MKLIADESIDFGIICALRSKGFSVISIIEDFSGISDNEVLKMAFENQLILTNNIT